MISNAEVKLLRALSDPKHPFRYTTTLARLVGDTHPDCAPTVALLESMGAIMAQGTEGGQLWCMYDNWELRVDGIIPPGIALYKVARNEEGHAIPRTTHA